MTLADAPGAPPWAAFVEATDPVDDLLLWADANSSLARLSTVWQRADALAFSFPLWPTRPALGVKGRTAGAEAALVAELVREGLWTTGYVICPFAQEPCWLAHGQATHRAEEVQMLLPRSAWGPPAARPQVRHGTLAELDRFYRHQGAAAWHPAQFETGPYVVAELAGRIVAAAGTHFAYPQLAQVGNVFTAPEARGQGWARACTAAVVDALVARGHATVSLFVATDNLPARHVYRELRFRDHRTLAAFCWDAPGGP